jgi:hypothetical protein
LGVAWSLRRLSAARRVESRAWRARSRSLGVGEVGRVAMGSSWRMTRWKVKEAVKVVRALLKASSAWSAWVVWGRAAKEMSSTIEMPMAAAISPAVLAGLVYMSRKVFRRDSDV